MACRALTSAGGRCTSSVAFLLIVAIRGLVVDRALEVGAHHDAILHVVGVLASALALALALAFPLALAAGMLGLPDLLEMNLGSEGIWILLATVLSGVVTYLALRSLLAIVRRGKIYVFGYYTLFVGAIVALLAVINNL